MEPERKIEKLLQAFAKKRREQAGNALELHPVARQQLQKEVSRLAAGKSEAGGFLSLLSRFRPRLAFALCFLALVSLSAWLLVPALTNRKSQSIASVETRLGKDVPAEESKVPPPAAPVVAAASPAEGADKKALADNRTAVFDSQTSATPQLAESPPPATPAQRKLETPPVASRDLNLALGVNTDADKYKAIDGFGENAGVAQPNSWAAVPAASKPVGRVELPASTSGVAALDSLALANKSDAAGSDRMLQSTVITNSLAMAPATTAAESEGNLQREKASAPGALAGARSYSFAKTAAAAAAPVASQRFYRADVPVTRQRAAATVSDATPVLTSFQLEQDGGNIRVVDADGSVYTGVLQAPTDELHKNPVRAQTSANQPAQAAQNYFFRVAGTNRNLNQNLVFSGSLIPLTNSVANKGSSGGFGGGGGGALRGAMEPSPQSVLSNVRISGKAVVGEKEIEVNATPAP